MIRNDENFIENTINDFGKKPRKLKFLLKIKKQEEIGDDSIKNRKRSASKIEVQSKGTAKKMRLARKKKTFLKEKIPKNEIVKKKNRVAISLNKDLSNLENIELDDSGSSDVVEENDENTSTKSNEILFVDCSARMLSKLDSIMIDENNDKKKSTRPSKMCEVCGKVMNSKLFKDHMNIHNDPSKVTCSHCGKLFSSVSTLRKHVVWTHTQLRPFMCDLCGSTFKRNDHLKLHAEQFHANDNGVSRPALKCEICGSSVQTMTTLQNHMKRIHGVSKVDSVQTAENHKILPDSSYECGICGLNFKQFNYLRIHIKFVHEQGLPWHINQSADGPYKCTPCLKSYATLQSLREHNRRLHDGLPVEKFKKQCEHCGVTYRNRLHFSKHLAKLSGRPTCYVCWDDFEDGEKLKIHINSCHVAELPFGCELCGIRFVYLTELRTHMYTHSEVKAFKCEVCSQAFVRKDFLKSHMRRHVGIRNHSCDECNKSFVEICDLHKHKQTHSKGKKADDDVIIC